MVEQNSFTSENINQDPMYALLREFKAKHFSLDSLIPLQANAVGIGRKIIQGQPTDRLCIRFYVSKKRPLSELSPSQRIPKSISFFSRQENKEVEITTDVIELPPFRFDANPQSRIRPVPGGVSISSFVLTGTLGGWVWDKTDDTFVMLTNSHVFGGSSFLELLGFPVIQPGTEDGGSSDDIIGRVKRVISLRESQINTVDCAIAEINDGDDVLLQVLEIGPAVYATEAANIGMPVEKYGKTTQHTFGEVQDVDFSTLIWSNLGFFQFEDCILVEATGVGNTWSAAGDSGSLVFSQTPTSSNSLIKPVIGLHFASSSSQNGLACKIQSVFNQLNLAPVCSGGFSAFIDSMFEAEITEPVRDEKVAHQSIPVPVAPEIVRTAPPPFVGKERRQYRASSLYRGLARDVQQRLKTTQRGRLITDFVDQYRADLLPLLIFDGDVRRSAVVALKALLRGSTTTTDVLERVLTAEDLQRLDKLGQELLRKSNPQFKAALERVLDLKPECPGKSLGEIVQIKAL